MNRIYGNSLIFPQLPSNLYNKEAEAQGEFSTETKLNMKVLKMYLFAFVSIGIQNKLNLINKDQ